MLAKIKAYWNYAIEVALVIITGAFLYERSRNKTNEALVDNQKSLEQVNKDKVQIEVNQGQLKAEEEKRTEIQKEASDAKSDNTDSTTDFLNKR